MTTFDTSLLPPPETREEQYPYRRVWRTALIEAGLLILITLSVNLGVALLDIQVAPRQYPLFTALLALLPVGFWFLFSWREERLASQPREGLLQVFFISALVANAAAEPFIDLIIEPDLWLNTVPGITRIFGYMLTVGIVYESLKYLVIRYLAWPQGFRQRIDGVAYSLAASVGFATVINLRFALLDGGAQPEAALIRITSVALAQQGIGLVMGHRLAMLKFGRVGIFSLVGGLFLGAFLTGLFFALRAGLTVGSFGIGATANTPLLGFGFVAVFALALYGVFGFLINAAEARESRAPGMPVVTRRPDRSERRVR